MRKTYLMLIIDGWGIGEPSESNAFENANTPNLDKLFKEYPHTEIETSGLSVGLPEGQIGNSEVGHLNIGGGRIVYQDLTRISKDIEDGIFQKNKKIIKAIDRAKNSGKKLHLLGLLSDGGVHSHLDHLYAILELCKDREFYDVYIHGFMDGRDVPPKTGLEYIKAVQKKMEEIGVGSLVSISGRYYAMDRDKRWDRIKLAYDVLVEGIGQKYEDPILLMNDSYEKDITDEFIVPTIINKKDEDIIKIEDGDSIFFYNFRPDRAREITDALIESNFDGFERERLSDLYFLTMTQYDESFENVNVVYEQNILEQTLGQIISERGLKQLRVAETEKYAHVTYFFNGGREEAFEGEDRILIHSSGVATYDLLPKMCAFEVKDKVLESIGKYDLIILNFANPDMVGHTGVYDAAVEAMEVVDECVGKIIRELIEKGGEGIISADHGNLEQMMDEEGNPFTAHTTNLVPFIYIGDKDVKLRNSGNLSDFAPTILDMMKIEKPEEMTGNSLIERG